LTRDDSKGGPWHSANIMLLIRHSERANNAVRAVSPGGELFVASVVIFMILVSFGDAVDPALFGETSLEFSLFDLGGEFSVLALRDLHLLQLLVAGGLLAAGLGVLRLGGARAQKILRSAPRRAIDKVPL
jgi:hypothetical protein